MDMLTSIQRFNGLVSDSQQIPFNGFGDHVAETQTFLLLHYRVNARALIHNNKKVLSRKLYLCSM
jgi:hypothetical protein